MIVFLRTAGLFVLFILSISCAEAQSVQKKWGLGVFGGTNQYSGDLGTRIYAFDQAAYGFGGLSLNRYLSPSFNIAAQGTYGAFGYSNKEHCFSGHKIDFDLIFILKLNNGMVLPAESKLSPFLMAGFGSAGYYGSEILYVTREGYRVNDLIVPVGAGIKYQLSERIAVQYSFLYKFTDHDVRDRYLEAGRQDGRQDHYGQQNLGLIYSLGRTIYDADQDGIEDKFDLCPYTPPGVPVDSVGCPFDSDHDGVYDYADRCPGIVGKASAAGCPDKDGDGVSDKEDKCPEEFGRTGMVGCPDSDEDGVTDSEDECPQQPGVKKHNGCPDTDNDGIPDKEDECPFREGTHDLKGCPDMDQDGVPDHTDVCPGIAGKPSTQGCPDTDGDGIHDLIDKCPAKSGTHKNKGCPEISKETLKILDQALAGVKFESGKDIIKPSSFGILDQVSEVLKNNEEFTLLLEGHTDNQGDAEKNILLSRNRAEAVRLYILAKGIHENRITAQGFGDTRPVADNSTAEGRSKNRRVEFKIEF